MLKMSIVLPVGLAMLCVSLGSVNVAAQTDVTIAIVPLVVAGPDDLTTTLPVPQTNFPLGDMVVEVWAQTLAPVGFAQASVDFGFPQGAFTATSVTHTSTFSIFPSGIIDNVNGLVDDLSGSVQPVVPACSGAVGFTPQWARVAIINMQATAAGPADLVIGPTNNLVFVNANCGSTDPPAVTFLGATITINGPPLPIPTTSSWGILAMTLLTLTVGTMVFSRRRIRMRVNA